MRVLHQAVPDTCRAAGCLLWDAYARSGGSQFGVSGLDRLISSPDQGRNKKGLRVSEQEARCVFVKALGQRPLRYSVEAPTSRLDQFSGKTPLAAQTDLAVHDVSETHICNV